jgi:dipeptidyl aminopeptidase/acylaminoacyl peptidase
LADARRQHPTVLSDAGSSPQEFDEVSPAGVERITFDSDGRTLFGWLGKPPGDGPFPAVLHIHSGFALGATDFDEVRPLVNAGYVVLVPSWRGENGNPGNFELCRGEVDDALAALDYLSGRPEVDPRRLFATGHSIGGISAMLLAELSPNLRGVMACGAIPDMQTLFDRGMGIELPKMPFDPHSRLEGDLRSPARHVADLKCPLLLCYGSKEGQLPRHQADLFQQSAAQRGKRVQIEAFAGANHLTAFAPAVARSIEFFNELAPAEPAPAEKPGP